MPHADLVAIDGTNLAHRVWHAAGCDPYRASVTYTSMVRTAIQIHDPIWAAVAFDAPTCFRKRVDPTYKAQRPPREARFVDWIDGLRGLERVAGARVIVSVDHEADDVLATLAYQALQQGEHLTTMLVTGDQDAYALIGPRVAVALMSTGAGARYVNAEQVAVTLGVPPNLVLPYKSLVGDPSDNVKGVPGIGPVRARKAFHHCEGCLQLRGRAAIEMAVRYLEPTQMRCSPEDALGLALKAYAMVRPVYRAPLKRGLLDLEVVE